MIEALGRVKLFLIILTLVIIAIMLCLFIIKSNTEKIPSRGVFVKYCISAENGIG